MGSGKSKPKAAPSDASVSTPTPTRGNVVKVIEKNTPLAPPPHPDSGGKGGAKSAATTSARETGDTALLFEAFRQVPYQRSRRACASRARPRSLPGGVRAFVNA